MGLRSLGNLVTKHSRSPILFLVLITVAFLQSGIVYMSTNPDQITEENDALPYPNEILNLISDGIRTINLVV